MKKYDKSEFAITVQSENESQHILQLERPKEGDLIQTQFSGPHYEYLGNQILYLSDLHLDHILAASKCKTKEDEYSVLQSIGRGLEASYNEYAYIGTDGNIIVLINGDITSSPELFQIFTGMDFKFLKKALIILGNHELWAYSGLTVKEIVAKYSRLTKTPVIQNEIVIFEDTYEYIGDNRSSRYVRYQNKRISYDVAMATPADELAEEMSSARVVLLAGIGFSGCNNAFNADKGIYRFTISREQEIAESKKFEELYKHFVAATKTLKDRILVVATHMPLEDWCSSPIYENDIIYISGHTHKNFFHDDGIQRIYADNQNGYYGRNPKFKCVYTDDMFDPFISYEDGIYRISKKDYLQFYRAKKLKMVLNRNLPTLYMLKKKGYYCFLVRLASGNLSILNGGSYGKLEIDDEEYYYENMDKLITHLSKPLDDYTSAQKEIAENIKSIGGSGTIHGCIIDLDFLNHIYVNPVDMSIKGYYALDMINKWVYDSVPKLLEEHAPKLFEKFLLQSKSEKENALISYSSSSTQPDSDGHLYLETDIYIASRELCKMQKMHNNVLSYWNESLITRTEVSGKNTLQIQDQMPCNNDPLQIPGSKPNLSAWSKG